MNPKNSPPHRIKCHSEKPLAELAGLLKRFHENEEAIRNLPPERRDPRYWIEPK
jgi:hypothetical protein